ncbi:MAG TPA: alpha/beta hydrolase [Symbiobacteriaceae bacterium]|nr:alpha/beta hydrolase [Symbiobacteriaceae bacterium]
MISERTGNFTGAGGVRLFFRIWEPEAPRATLVLVHGMNEHIGRYAHVAQFFAERGFAVYGMDHRGYGQSEGPRCHVNRFEEYLEDLRLLVDMAQERTRPFMVGHSLGGLIAFRYALAYPDTIEALVVSSPFFAQKTKVDPVTRALAPILSLMLPRLQLSVPFAPENVCRDPDIVQKYATDPLVGRKATPRWFTEATRAGLACHQGLTQSMKLPVLFLQAGDDLIVDPEGTRAVYAQVPHQRKAFKLYPGKYHEIFNDPGREEVFQDILNWLQEQELLPTV